MANGDQVALSAELFLHEHSEVVVVHRVRGHEELSRAFFLEVVVHVVRREGVGHRCSSVKA